MAPDIITNYFSPWKRIMRITSTHTKWMACAFMNCSVGVKSQKGGLCFPHPCRTASDDDDDDTDEVHTYAPTHCSKSFTCLNRHNTYTLAVSSTVISFYTWGNPSTEKLHNLLKITQQQLSSKESKPRQPYPKLKLLPQKKMGKWYV